MREINIVIDKDGSTTIEVDGVEGKECKALTAAIEAAIGVTTKTVTKPEYHRVRAIQRKVEA